MKENKIEEIKVEDVKKNLERSTRERKEDKSQPKIKQETVVSRDHQGVEKTKYINTITYPSGLVERKLVGLKKGKRVIFDKGIKK